MVFKKFCTLHALEFVGETCPECEKILNNKSEIKTKTLSRSKQKEKKIQKTKKTKKKKFNKVENDEIFNNKLKELIEKYNK